MHEGLDARTLPGVNATSKTSEMPAGPITLGELLYADPGIAAVSEGDWLALVRAIAASETSAPDQATEMRSPDLRDTNASRDQQTIPVAEGHLRVGKREVDRGGVRVRSYVVEEPVREEVTLRNERVKVQQRSAAISQCLCDQSESG
ncbi:DUF2382 domain-containing protein [Steroidobacter cummioxidans]|uniref:DUF2382 domain-containing protein n=1 Tax=Steroidobacter cummioxidans TaxID=1803913 RepID=UPI0019D49E1E|nr:DUF2382 domain-containing protein [Steroidobacter cummioxidans]